jgi:hypothetical protein
MTLSKSESKDVGPLQFEKVDSFVIIDIVDKALKVEIDYDCRSDVPWTALCYSCF